MSTVSTAFSAITTESCALLILDITETNLSTSNLGAPKGFLQAVTSPENVGSFKLAINPNKDIPGASSHQKVYTSDTIRDCNVTSEASGPCATPAYSADDVAAKFKAVEHRIEESIQRKITMDLDAFKEFCISPQEYVTKRLLAMRDGVLGEVNAKLVPKAIAYAGAYSSGVSSVVPSVAVSFMVDGANGGKLFDPTGYAKILDEFAKLGSPYVTPFVVGGSHAAYIKTFAGFATGANQNGVTSSIIPNLYVDYTVDTTFENGLNNLVTWAPGTIQVAGTNAVTDAMIAYSRPMEREKARVPDPFGTGLGDFDFYFNIDDTGCLIELTWEKYFDLIVPVPYGTCANKPILNFLVDCSGNDCADSSSGSAE